MKFQFYLDLVAYKAAKTKQQEGETGAVAPPNYESKQFMSAILVPFYL